MENNNVKEQVPKEQAENINKQTDIFKLPIYYLEDKKELDANLINDLELKTTVEHKSLYNYVFNPSNKFSQKTCELWSKYYCTNTEFIKQTQELLHSQKLLQTQTKDEIHKQPTIDAIMIEKVSEVYDEICTETGFIEKYYYIEYSHFQQFNNNSQFLQWLSLYNMTSPVLSLFIPVLFLIMPLFLIKMQGYPITIAMYLEILKQLFQKHQIGKLFSMQGGLGMDKIVYVIFSLIMYVTQIYYNIMTCIKFYKNMKKIHEQLFIMRDYLDLTIKQMETFIQTANELELTTYQPFIEDVTTHLRVLKHFHKEYCSIAPNKISFAKFKQIGYTMKCFYQLYKNEDYNKSLVYSFGFNGFINNLQELQKNIKENKLGTCKFLKGNTSSDSNKKDSKSKKTKNKHIKISFEDAYFAPLVNANPVKNSYTLDKHMIITGPNAAGKTTMLKTTIFNILLSQQIGFGFYKKAKLAPYDYIHCYINIPDTSGRDSLFQAEARRCKNILDLIEQSSNESRHFCIFDELYSGTNPYEAISSAYAYLKYLNKYDNLNFMLTTHYLDLCKKLDGIEHINNYHMNILTHNDHSDANHGSSSFVYTYELKEGISSIKGGIKVLSDLNYPKDIIFNTQQLIDKIRGT